MDVSIQNSWGLLYDPSLHRSAKFFFLQAEDSIRDKLVTGVQTCALPISDQPPGYLVADSNGRLVGRVECAMYGTQPEVPDALAVHSAFDAAEIGRANG